jgi:hypothetical protein
MVLSRELVVDNSYEGLNNGNNNIVDIGFFAKLFWGSSKDTHCHCGDFYLWYEYRTLEFALRLFLIVRMVSRALDMSLFYLNPQRKSKI